MIQAERIAEAFVDVADTLVDEFDLIEFLQTVTSHAAELIDAHAAGLLLADHRGRLQLMAASDERSHSVRSASRGSTASARRTGCHAASSAAAASVNVTVRMTAAAPWPPPSMPARNR